LGDEILIPTLVGTKRDENWITPPPSLPPSRERWGIEGGFSEEGDIKDEYYQ
jgi:hypothetical protein